MRIRLLLSLIFLVFFAAPSIAQQGIFVNEVMASNQNNIADNTGDFADWVELYNSNSSPVVLDGYYVSDDIANPLKFRLSGNVQIPANGYLILWGSDDTLRGRTHLPFKFSASGESFSLYMPDGLTLVNSISFGQQKADISYGRTTDGSPDFSFFAIPTPAASNNTSTGYLGILNPPVFSTAAGFYQNPFTLNISSSDPGVDISYTIDGSSPDTSNKKGTIYRYKNVYANQSTNVGGPFLNDSFRTNSYVTPLPITDASLNPNRLSIKSSSNEFSYSGIPATIINKATIVRAVVTKAGYISSEIATSSYFITPDGKNKYTLPVVSLSMSEDQLYSWDKGIYNAGADFDQWRAANPTLNVIGGEPANWYRDEEYPMSFELFKANNTARQLQTNAGWTINGNYSASKVQKAFRVIFRSSYGASDLNFPIFSDLPYKNYERLILRNSGQDMTSTHIRDMAIQNCVKHLRFDIQHGQPAVTFVNGEYWGLLNFRERYDDNFFTQKYGIGQLELDFIEKNVTVKDGDNIDIINLRNYLATNDLANPDNYQYIKTRMDVDNFMDYQIAEVYFGNNDWPANNVLFYRKKTAYNPAAVPKEQDGRWRWVINDLDRGMGAPWSNSGGAPYNTLSLAIGTRNDIVPPTPTWATIFLSKLLANPEFRNQFITRYADLNNTTFLPGNITSEINYFRDMVSPEIAEHLNRWRRPANATAWNDTVNRMITFADQRPAFARQHLRQQFSLSSEQLLTIDVSDSAQGFITVNSIDITPAFPGVPAQAYPWQGLYYPEVPVTLIAKPKPGSRFLRWEGDSASTRDTLVTMLSRAKFFKAVFESTDIPVSKVFQYWHFNKQPLPPTRLTTVTADTSLSGNAFITYEGTGTGYMDVTTNAAEGSNLNLQFGYPSGNALRVRNPSAARTLIINAPTTGFKNIVLKYATTRTTSGAQSQRVFYSTDGTTWILKADNIAVVTPETTFGLQTFDFAADVSSDNNPLFKIKIEFFGTNATATSGNNRFDNITLSGVPLFKDPPATKITISSDRPGSICADSKVTFTATLNKVIPTPAFQWKKNGVNVGNNTSTYIDASFQNKDTVYCILTENSTPIVSNKIVLTIIPNFMLVRSLNTTSPSACSNNGIIVINATGGTAPFSYSLNNVDYFPSNTFTNLAVGSYTAYVQDVKGCSATPVSSTLTTGFTITGLTKTTASACKDDGSITINSIGGTPPLQYSLNNVDYFTSNVFNNLAAGNYTATVKDANGCVTAAFSDVITKVSPLIFSNLFRSTPSSCGGLDGALTIVVTGGTTPYQYSLNNVDYFSGNVFSNLAAGSYTAYVKDARGCSTVRSEVLLQLAPLTVSSVTRTAPSACNSSNGSLTINPSGGSGTFTYSINNINYFTSNLFTNLPSGTYVTYVKDSKGCIASLPATINAPSSLVITSLTKTAATGCNADGSIAINLTGGAAPYQYSLNNINYFSTNTFNNLTGGAYTAYVKDANGCTATLSDVLARGSTLAITSLTKTAASACSSDGSITINSTGGVLPLQYSLNNVNYFSSNIFNNLIARAYVAYVKDANGCIATFSDVITKNPLLVISSLSKTAASACNTNGSITINSTGGTLPLQYSLNNVNYFTSNVFSNLAAGSYTGFVKDAKGCIYTLSDILTKAPTLVITGVSKTDPTACNANGSIAISASGGTAPLQYSRDNITYSSGNAFSNLAAGIYTVYTKDANGCIASTAVTLTATSPLVISEVAKSDPSACNANGSITISASGGTNPLQYSLDNITYSTGNVFSNLAAGNFTAYVKDANGCTTSTATTLNATPALVITGVSKTDPSACNANGSITISASGGTPTLQYSRDNITFSSGNAFSNLAAGNYTVYVKDANGCTTSAPATLNPTSPPAITDVSKVDPSACVTNGSLTVSATGGTAPLQYSRDNITYSSGNAFSNLAAGNYTVYVKDVNGCTTSAPATLNPTSPPAITGVSKVDPSACVANGSLTISATGGTAPLQYSRNNITYSSGNAFSNLPAGNYTVYVKDANGCTTSTPATLTAAPALIITGLSKTDPSTCNLSDGKIIINSAGGTPPYQYSLNGVDYSSSNEFNNLAGGTYTAYTKDASGCIATISGVLTNTSTLVITGLSNTDPSACIANGSIAINSSGGTPPLEYSLDNITYSSGNAFSDLAAGNYTAYVKDASGCTTSSATTLNATPALAITGVSKIDPAACSVNGSITISASGGTAPLQYSLDDVNYSVTNLFSNLPAGNYTAYVKDVNGCTTSTPATLNPTSPVVITGLSNTDPSACNADGAITINSSGGTPPLQYSIDDINYFSTNTFSNLAAGSYTAYTKDVNGCATSTTTSLTAAPAIAVIVIAKTDPSACIANGDLTVSASGGTPPYQYSLDNVNYFSSNVFSNLASGNYTAYAKDAKGCITSVAETLNAAPTLAITGLSTTDPTACNANGSITISASGGTAPLQYSRDNITYSSGNAFSNLAAGNYTAYVKDARGCTTSSPATLNAISALVITDVSKVDPSACVANGSLTISASGGSAPLQYSRDNITYSSENAFSNLAAGNYTVYVKDVNGCTTSAPATLNPTSPPAITGVSKVEPSACVANGSLTISASGGTAPLQYSRDNITYSSGNAFSNLAAGNYTVYVKDANGCTASAPATLNPTSPSAINGVSKTDPTACNANGSITISASGGTAPLQYSKDNITYSTVNEFSNLAAGNYTVYVKDANGCTASTAVILTATSPLVITGVSKIDPSACAVNGSITINSTGGTAPLLYSRDNVNYSSVNTFSNLAAGNYTVYVKDANGCTASTTTTLNATSLLVITSVSKTDPTACNANGTITISASGGTAPLQYSLNNVNYFFTNIFSNLAAGNYTAYVKDARGCSTASTAVTTLNTTSSLVITSVSKVAASACNDDGSITINRTGGTAPFSYSLNNINYFSSNIFTNLAAGNFTAYVKDANGCIASISDVVTKTAALVISNLFEITASGCAADGKITIERTGGTSPFQYSLNNVNYFSSNIFSNQAAGSYTAYVKDARGCITVRSDVLNQYAPLLISSVTRVAPSACGNSNGSLTINKSGGTTPFTYSINGINYFTSNVFSNLASGTYITYVKDTKGCIASLAATINAPSSLVITSLTKVAASGCNANGSITINRTGGTPPFLYSLNNVNYFSSNVFTNLAGGSYTAYVKDASGCTATRADILANGSTLVITSLTKTAASACNSDGTITINRTGGTAPFLYSLDNVNYTSSNVFTNLAARSYVAFVKDVNGCIASISDVITKTSPLIVSSLTKTAASACNADGSIAINATGGTPPLQYSLNNVNYFSGNTFLNLSAGSYTGFVKDARGCVSTLADVVTKASPLVITSVGITNPTVCLNNGKITINSSGGTAPYTYSLDNLIYFSSNEFPNLPVGNYTAYVKDVKNCIGTLNNIILTAPACFTKASLAEPKLYAYPTKLSIKAYPNPSTEQFSVIAVSDDKREVEVIVTDMLGRKVLQTIIAPNSTFRFGKDLKAGTYIVGAFQGKQKAIVNVVKGK